MTAVDKRAKKCYTKKDENSQGKIMKLEEWIGSLSEEAKKNAYRFEMLRDCIPLGFFSGGEIALAHLKQQPERNHFTFASGEHGKEFIQNLALSLAVLYDRSEAQFLLLSPRSELKPLLKLQNADINALYVQTEQDFSLAVEGIKALANLQKRGVGYPKLIVVAEGLEEIDGIYQDDITEPYIRLHEALGDSVCELSATADLNQSRYFTFPGAFLGIGNCLVATKTPGKADVTHVGADSSLSLPREISYPHEDSLEESVSFFNGLEQEGESQE